MNRRRVLYAISGLVGLAGCTSTSGQGSGGLTPTTEQAPCEPPGDKPAEVVSVSDDSLSRQEVRTDTDVYPSHEAGAIGIYNDASGAQLVLAAYRFGSTSDAQSAVEQELNLERNVVAQLQLENWLLISQAPEKQQARSLILSASVSGSCRRELTLFEPQTFDGFTLGSNGQPWQGVTVDLRGGSPAEIRSSLDNPVPVILTGDTIHTAYVKTQDYDTVRQSAKQAGLEVLSTLPVSLEGLPVCEIGSRIRIPSRISESNVREAFPDLIRLNELVSSSGGRHWMILSRLDSASEISDRLNDFQVEEDRKSVQIYSDCNVNN